MWKIDLATSRLALKGLFMLGAVWGLDGRVALAQGQAKMPTRALLQPAAGDPFSPFLAAAPSLQTQKRVQAAVVTPMPVAVPIVQAALPPIDLTFLGRVGSDKDVQVFALHQGRTVLLQAGEALPNGYVVESVGAREVQLRHASLDQLSRWPLPAPPIFETR